MENKRYSRPRRGTADGAGGGFGGLGGAEDDAASGDDAIALPNHGDDGARGHVLEEAWEEGLGHKVLVVLLEQRLVCTREATLQT